MPNKTVRQYELAERIGSDGRGIVWKARDTKLDRDVALKFLPEDLRSDFSYRERFFREAKAASALNHRNIVTIYEINSQGDELFIAMELVRGVTLSDVLRDQGRFSPQVVANYAAQLCEGLGAAHRAGIIHRDIKPSNLMVTHDGILKILDFGLAKLSPLETEASNRSTVAAPLTMAGAVVGTIPYMSPEQLVGGDVDPRSDVFAVGVVLFEMLTGKRPFQGSSNSEIARAILSMEPPPLMASLADIPELLAHVTAKCLQKSPAARYADAGKIGEALRNPQIDHLNKNGRRTLRLAAMAAMAAVLGAALFAGYRSTAWVKNAAPAVETRSSVEALRDAESALRRFDRKGNVDRAIGTLESSVRVNGSNPALHAVLAEAYVRKFTDTSDKHWLEMAAASSQRAITLNDDLAEAHVARGQAYSASGQKTEAAREFERARDLNPHSGAAYLGLASLAANSKDAEPLFKKAAEYNGGDWMPANALAAFYYREARYDESLSTWQEALRLAPDNPRLLVNQAAAFHMKGAYADAADLIQSALKLDDTAPLTWANLGTARYFQGRFPDAIRAQEKAVELAPSRYLYWGNLADSYRWSDDMKSRAPDAYRKAVDRVQDELKRAPADDSLRSSLAVYFAKLGDVGQALQELGRIQSSTQGDKAVLFKTALVYELAGNRTNALDALARAIRAGYSMHEIEHEPELARLRSDRRYSAIVREK